MGIKMPLSKEAKSKVKPATYSKQTTPLWKGPQDPNGGVTYSLLSRFIQCRERFRLLVVKGIKPIRHFNPKASYGDMWHVCEEAHAGNNPWQIALKKYVEGLANVYPTNKNEIEHWYLVCSVQFPQYLKYWEKHQDTINRAPLLQEYEFNVPYTLPSGATVRLRGKMDSVDIITTKKEKSIWLMENKTKGNPRDEQIANQLTFDLQTMLYLTALHHIDTKTIKGWPTKARIAGVRYNVVKRPLSGGKGTIKRHKEKSKKTKGGIIVTPAETKEHYYGRVGKYIEQTPGDYFKRWNANISNKEITRFKDETLNPLLTQLVQWWDWIAYCEGEKISPFVRHHTYSADIHWRHPFGVYNALDEGGSTDLDEYLNNGSMVGLTQVDNLFPELSAI